MGRKQLHPFDHSLFLVIEEPILTRLEAGYDRMLCRCRMLGCMLARRTVTASDVPTLRAPAEVKPPTVRGREALHTPIATRFRSGVDSAHTFFHSRSSFRVFARKRRRRAQRMSGHQQYLPDTAFFSGCLSFGRFTKWQFLANRDD